jgi:hypothetical protein
MEERRKHPRRYINFFTRVFDQQSGDLLGYLGDITTAGAMVISESRVEVGKTFKLRMDLPEQQFGKDRLTVEARSLWCQPDITPQFFNTGFEFQRIEEEDTQVIERIVQQYGVRG